MPPRKKTGKRRSRAKPAREKLPVEEYERKRRANISPHDFKKGQSGNPRGSSKRQRLRRILWDKLNDVAKGTDGKPLRDSNGNEQTVSDVLMSLYIGAGKKDWRAIQSIFEVFEGKAKQPMEDVSKELSYKDVLRKLSLEHQLAVLKATKEAEEEQDG